jgi:hypothetical protein
MHTPDYKIATPNNGEANTNGNGASGQPRGNRATVDEQKVLEYAQLDIDLPSLYYTKTGAEYEALCEKAHQMREQPTDRERHLAKKLWNRAMCEGPVLRQQIDRLLQQLNLK